MNRPKSNHLEHSLLNLPGGGRDSRLCRAGVGISTTLQFRRNRTLAGPKSVLAAYSIGVRRTGCSQANNRSYKLMGHMRILMIMRFS